MHALSVLITWDIGLSNWKTDKSESLPTLRA
jgi:hypothetical protein